jgi:hypothetical protein
VLVSYRDGSTRRERINLVQEGRLESAAVIFGGWQRPL